MFEGVKKPLKRLWIPPDEQEEAQQAKKRVEPVPDIDGKKFIGSGEDANVGYQPQEIAGYYP
jgi:hypothetical protein